MSASDSKEDNLPLNEFLHHVHARGAYMYISTRMGIMLQAQLARQTRPYISTRRLRWAVLKTVGFCALLTTWAWTRTTGV